MHLRSLTLTVAALALLGGATAWACDDRAEVKGPVHITSRGVEFIDKFPDEEASHRVEPRIALHIERRNEATVADREMVREHLRIVRAVAAAADEVAREVNEERNEIGREVIETVREMAREFEREHGRIGREVAAAAREAAREVARHQREIASAAREAAREVARSRHVQVYVQKAMLVARDALGQAHDGLADAERDLQRQMRKLDAMVDGNFADVVVERNGVVKCGDLAKHPGCAPLTEEDKETIRETTQAALEQAQAGLEAARDGLEAAAEAMSSVD